VRDALRKCWDFLNESLLGHFIGLLLIMLLWLLFVYLMGWDWGGLK
jgi:hypothetical protein